MNAVPGGPGVAERNAFVHPALFYRDDEEYLAGTVSFVREGRAAGQPTEVAGEAQREPCRPTGDH